jgi:hypothetical protein
MKLNEILVLTITPSFTAETYLTIEERKRNGEGKRANDYVVLLDVSQYESGVPQQSEFKCVSTHLSVIQKVVVIAMKNLILPCFVVSWTSTAVSSLNCCCPAANIFLYTCFRTPTLMFYLCHVRPRHSLSG